MQEIKYAYAAGLLEGEGCFSMHTRKSNNKLEFAIHCEMTDFEPVNFLMKTFTVGSVCYRENKRKDGMIRKPSWIWSVQSKKDIVFVIKTILPYMVSDRRITKCNLILKEIESGI